MEQELSQLRQQQAEWELDVMQQEERLREKWEELQVQRSAGLVASARHLRVCPWLRVQLHSGLFHLFFWENSHGLL